MKKKNYLPVCILIALILAAINVNTFLNTKGSYNLLNFTVESLADETSSGESPNWQVALEMTEKKILIGYDHVYVPSITGGYYHSYPKYIYIDCCVGSAVANSCNKSAEDSRCKSGS